MPAGDRIAAYSDPEASPRRLTLAEATAPRRGLSRPLAALYLGVSATKFDEMAADGRMPKPRRIDSRVIWDVRELDEAFDALPHQGEEDEGVNPWDGIAE